MYCILFAAIPVYLSSLAMRETYKKIILQKRAKRLNIAPPPQVGPAGAAAIKFLLTVTLFRPLHMLIAEPIVGFLSLYTAVSFLTFVPNTSQLTCSVSLPLQSFSASSPHSLSFSAESTASQHLKSA